MAGRWADDGDGAAFSGERHLARGNRLPGVTPSSVLRGSPGGDMGMGGKRAKILSLYGAFRAPSSNLVNKRAKA